MDPGHHLSNEGLSGHEDVDEAGQGGVTRVVDDDVVHLLRARGLCLHQLVLILIHLESEMCQTIMKKGLNYFTQQRRYCIFDWDCKRFANI